MLKDVSAFMSNNQQGISDYKTFFYMMEKYESLNFTNYVDGDGTKMIFAN